MQTFPECAGMLYHITYNASFAVPKKICKVLMMMRTVSLVWAGAMEKGELSCVGVALWAK